MPCLSAPASPRSSKGMQDDLVIELEAFGLAKYCQKLEELGVRSAGDLRYLQDKDLLSTGMNVVQIRKLQSGMQPLPKAEQGDDAGSGSRPTSRRHEAWGAGDAEDDEASEGGDVQKSNTSPSNRSEWVRTSGDGQHIEVWPLRRVETTTRRKHSLFWSNQMRGRPLRLVFVRHGESEANVNRSITKVVPDHMLHLSGQGRQQALDAGVRLKDLVGSQSIRFVVSPYVRTQETVNGIVRAWGGEKLLVREDVRIREQEYGNFDHPDMGSLHKEKRKFGPFYYRFPEGESPADCYDRASLFLESLYRSWDDNEHQNQVVVCHGMMILVTLMRLLRLPIAEFDNLDSLKNCEFIVLERPQEDAKYSISYTWAPGEDKNYKGLRRKAHASPQPDLQIWDGDPDAPLVTSVSSSAAAGQPAAAAA